MTTFRAPFGLFGRQAPDEDAEAARLMWHVRHVQRNAGVPVFAMETVRPDGARVRAQVFGTDERASAKRDEAPEPGQQPSGGPTRLVWQPEGFVMVPRSAAAPHGWGLPPTPDGKGTPGGDFPFVLVNHHRHANYPEYLASVYAAPLTGAHPLWSWTLQYRDAEDSPAAPATQRLGAWALRGGAPVLLGQYAGRWLNLLRERRQPEWFCHRPALRPFASAAESAALDASNALRAAAGMASLSRPLLGWSASMSAMVLRETIVSGALGHNSTRFRPGYQSVQQRLAWCFGAAVSENVLERPTDDWTSPAYGAATVAQWQASPTHYANLIDDYTAGFRATRADPQQMAGWYQSWLPWNSPALGASQLFAEVVDMSTSAPFSMREYPAAPGAVWPPDVNIMEPPVTTNAAAQVFGSVLSIRHLTSRRTWAHPGVGQLHVGGEAAQPMFCLMQRPMYLVNDFVRFKQAIWRVVPLASERQRAVVLGAGLVALAQTAGIAEFDAAVAEKRRREDKYDQRRLVAGQPVDDSCRFSEQEISPTDAWRQRRLRYLVYEETGAPNQAPPRAGSQRLVVYEAPADALPIDPVRIEDQNHAPWTPEEVVALALPANVLELSYAAASRDGSRFVMAYSTPMEAPSQRVNTETLALSAAVEPCMGERLTFVEFDGSSWRGLGESVLPITVSTAGVYRQDINHRCHLMASYGGASGNELRWIDLEVDGFTQTDWGAADGEVFRRLTSTLIFPGGQRFVFNDLTNRWPQTEEGVIRHIVYLDPERPERTVYVQYDIVPHPASGAVATSRLMVGIASPVVLRTLAVEEPLADIPAPSPSVGVKPLIGFEAPPINARSQLRSGYAREAAATNFHGTFWHGSAGSATGADATRYADSNWRPACVPMAPMFVQSQILHLGDQHWVEGEFGVTKPGLRGVINAAEYEGDYIVAGWLDENVAGPNDLSADNRFFYYASFNLPQAVGEPGLGNNILPLWSM